ncbi:protein jag [Sanguibacter antarcticus]|uniref:SpoIIIJ-associated protein n=1 Tax=Sanguibacter antarcticus TaxID=372484 RepID=A0A2A9E931_9MICO|nr:R3H domain-containing nucleic acid-binding protein [Sanguibacter antarcticus]PFG34732.1 spoIIIJ-associated protein [Sanguibacter antarcticus]
MTASTDSPATEPEGRTKTSLLEEEGEVAADYLEELLDIADLDGDIDIDVDHGRAALEVVADDQESLRHLVGRNGEVLEALQELTRLAVQTRTGERSRLMLDVAGYRAGRRVELTALATTIIEKVKSSGEKVALEPLNAFERKVVHDVVTDAGLVSESFGVDPQRYIQVSPAE